MVRFIEEAGTAIRSTACAVLSANEFINGGIGRATGQNLQSYADAIAATRRLIGCDPANDVQPPPPPFTGGQCPARYTFTASGTGPTSGGGGVCGPNTQNLTVGNSLWGPITNLRRGAQFCAGDNGTASAWVVTAFGSGGNGQASANPSTFVVLQNAYSASLSNFVRTDGQADNCGNPPIVYPPPTNFDIDVDVTYQPDFGPEITVPITLEYSPFNVDFNGDVVFPFKFDFGGFTFDGSLSFNPDVNIRINPPRLPRGTGQGTEDVDPDPPGEGVEPITAEEKIIGAVVISQVVNDGKISSYSSPEIPDIFVPRLGSVKFAYSFGGATFWSTDIDIKDARTFIECPFSQGADAVVGSPQVGVNMSTIPIRGYPLATTLDVGGD